MQRMVSILENDNLNVAFIVFDMHFERYKENLKSDLRKVSPITGNQVGRIKSYLKSVY